MHFHLQENKNLIRKVFYPFAVIRLLEIISFGIKIWYNKYVNYFRLHLQKIIVRIEFKHWKLINF